MNEKYKIGDFGHARFIWGKKKFPVTMDCWGTVTDQDAHYVEFTDNDNFLYIVSKAKFNFVKEEFCPAV